MSIIISKQGQDTQKLEKSDFEKEDYLQNYIHKNPESIPVYEIEEDKKLFVIKREFPTNAGPIDALAVDRDGDIYIIETKLYKNPDKRTVVAQALDYGAALWKHLNDFDDFIETLNQETQKKFKLTFQGKIEEFFKIDSEQSGFTLDTLKKNLNEGNLKFVILMDSIDERLKDLIIYVNQNSQFDIYAVQLEYYQFEKYEIMIPKIFGVEVKKNIRTSGSQRKRWTKEEFLQNAKEKSNKHIYETIKDLLEFSYQNADKITYGTGSSGVFIYKMNTLKGEITPFLAKSDGTIQLSLGWIKEQKKISDELVDALIKSLKNIPEAILDEGNKAQDIKIFFDVQSMSDKDITKFKIAVKEFTEKVRV